MYLSDISNPLTPQLGVSSKGANSPEVFSSVLGAVIRTFFVAGFVLFIIYFLIGALGWITSSGDPKAVEKARNSIIHAVIGMTVMLALFAILRLIESVFGVDILQIDLGGIKI